MKTIRNVRTYDSPPRSWTRDTLLAPATESELAKYFAGRAKLDFGKIWTGFFEPMLNAMDEDTRVELRDSLFDYEPSMSSGAMREGPAGSLASTGDDYDPLGHAKRNTNDRERCRDVGRPVSPDSINRANAKFWANRLSQPTHDVRAVGATPESINRANAKFWGARLR